MEIVFDCDNRYSEQLTDIFDRNNCGFVWDRAAVTGPMDKIVCLEQGRPLGYAILYYGPDFCEKEEYPASMKEKAARDCVYLWQIVVDRNETGKGIGSRLLRKVKERFQDREIYLCVDEENRNACRCYEKAGFMPVLSFDHAGHGRLCRYSIRKWVKNSGE